MTVLELLLCTDMKWIWQDDFELRA